MCLCVCACVSVYVCVCLNILPSFISKMSYLMVFSRVFKTITI